MSEPKRERDPFITTLLIAAVILGTLIAVLIVGQFVVVEQTTKTASVKELVCYEKNCQIIDQCMQQHHSWGVEIEAPLKYCNEFNVQCQITITQNVFDYLSSDKGSITKAIPVESLLPAYCFNKPWT